MNRQHEVNRTRTRRMDKLRVAVGAVSLGGLMAEALMIADADMSAGRIALGMAATGIGVAQAVQPAGRIIDVYSRGR